MQDDFVTFLTKCPTLYHFTTYARTLLRQCGFEELNEGEHWEQIPEKGFFIRDERMLIAWNDKGHDRAAITVTHDDSPCLILKHNFNDSTKSYSIARCYVYGGGLWHSWLGRDLRLAGRIGVILKDGTIKNYLYDSGKAIATIPYNQCNPLNPSFDADKLLNVILGGPQSGNLKDHISKKLGVEQKDIKVMDLRFIDAQKPTTFNGVIAGARLDNMTSTYAALKAFIENEPSGKAINVLGVYDNEEIGSETCCGGKSFAIKECLVRIMGEDSYTRMARNSLVMSFDTNHAEHPNYPGKTDPRSPCLAGRGVGVTAFGLSTRVDSMEAFMRSAALAGVGVQPINEFNRESGGSTIGGMTEVRTAALAADAGVGVFAMHSAREYGAVRDLGESVALLGAFYRGHAGINQDVGE